MKFFLGCLLIVISFTSNAGTIRLIEEGLGKISSVQLEFTINKELGRAWVTTVATYPSEPGDESGSFEDRTRILIPGMKYETNTKTIIIPNTKGDIICADVTTKGRGIFKRDVIRPNGKCMLKHTVETRTIDDGFEIYTRKYDVWDLIIE